MRVGLLGNGHLEYMAHLASALVNYCEVGIFLLDGLGAFMPGRWESKFPDLSRFRALYSRLLDPRVKILWVNPWPWKKDPRTFLGINSVL